MRNYCIAMIASNENFDTVRQQHQRLPSDEEKSTNHPSHTSIRSHITTDISNNPNDLDSSKLMDNIEKEQFENFPNNQIEKSGSMKETEQSRHEEIKTYRIRNFLLTLFILLSMSNAFHWIEYAIIENIITKYFNISTFWVNCTSTIYMFSYIIGIIPATFLLDLYGLRNCLIIGSFLNAFGSSIKCFAIERTRFWLVMIGQTSVAIAQLYILNIPPLLAATWFPSSEVTRATAYGVFGNQVGIAIGFVIPPLLMPNLDDNSKNSSTITVESLNSTVEAEKISPELMTEVERNLMILSIALALMTTIIFILIVIFFKDRPEIPPSHAQVLLRNIESSETKKSYWESFILLFRNINFILLFISYGLNTGVFYALSTVLSQMITRELGENFLVQAGYLGLSITLSGIFGSVICGHVLEWSGKFKLITTILYIFSLIGTIAFAISLHFNSMEFLFVSSTLLGFFMTGYLPIGFEFVAEISYPQPEGTSAGLLNASAQVDLF